MRTEQRLVAKLRIRVSFVTLVFVAACAPRAADVPTLVDQGPGSSDTSRSVAATAASAAAVAFTENGPEGSRVVVGGVDGMVHEIEGSVGGSDLQPSWSPEGQRLAFVRLGPAEASVVVAHLDTGEQSELSEPGTTLNVLGPVWSPAGTHIAYSRDGQVVIVEVDSGERDLVAVRGRAAHLEWSPGGTGLAYTAFLEDDSSVLCVVGVPDGTPSCPAASAGGETPRWSPDGTRLSYGDQEQVLVADAAFTEIRPLADGRFPAWSPDGTRIAYRDGSSLVSADAAGGGFQELAAGLGEVGGQTDWSDDAALVLTHGGDSGNSLLLVTVGTGDVTRVSDGARFATFSPGAVRRLSGPSRVETAAALSRDAHVSADTVLLARADDFADALAAAPLAGVLGGPVLLTQRDALSAAAAAEVSRLGARRAVLLGGTVAIGSQVEQELRDAGVTSVERIAGTERTETARLIADRLPAAPTAYIVNGGLDASSPGWPDAVAVSGLAALTGVPVLPVSRSSVPEATAGALDARGVTEVVIIGGAQAVAPEVAAELGQGGREVTRLAGADRYATSSSVAAAARQVLGDGWSSTWVSTGANWPDALAAGPAAAASGGVLLLSDPATLTCCLATQEFLAETVAGGRPVVLAGGPDVLRPPLELEIERLAA